MPTQPFTFRPITTWPGKFTRERRRSPFSARWDDTVDLLDRELYQLGASNVVLQVALEESDLRRDGTPRANARAHAHPGVILAFDSMYGPLKYATDVFTEWQANVRAIALGLEALRRVDRYGITKRGEQYTGWKALPAIVEPVMTTEIAARIVAEGSGFTAEAVLANPDAARTAYLRNARSAHPDAGGTTQAFQRLAEAKRILDAHHGTR